MTQHGDASVKTKLVNNNLGKSNIKLLALCNNSNDDNTNSDGHSYGDNDNDFCAFMDNELITPTQNDEHSSHPYKMKTDQTKI